MSGNINQLLGGLYSSARQRSRDNGMQNNHTKGPEYVQRAKTKTRKTCIKSFNFSLGSRQESNMSFIARLGRFILSARKQETHALSSYTEKASSVPAASTSAPAPFPLTPGPPLSKKEQRRRRKQGRHDPAAAASPPKYDKALAEIHEDLEPKISKAVPVVEEPPKVLTPLEERDAWIKSHIWLSSPIHHDQIITALGSSASPSSPYNTLPLLHQVVDGIRPAPNGSVGPTPREDELKQHLERGGVSKDLAAWTVDRLREELLERWAPAYWMGHGYCCYELVWQSSSGRYPLHQSATCSIHGTGRSSDWKSDVEVEDKLEMGPEIRPDAALELSANIEVENILEAEHVIRAEVNNVSGDERSIGSEHQQSLESAAYTC
ncbi:hypothetical protein PVAG01_05693 [Phlyctema vagabunda]|uniref:Uncharacterized protein n=1 Tax=Phlyctema vagabunda TaxID=108571 RepID=A0ABR4PKS8_9HELO